MNPTSQVPRIQQPKPPRKRRSTWAFVAAVLLAAPAIVSPLKPLFSQKIIDGMLGVATSTAALVGILVSEKTAKLQAHLADQQESETE